MRQNDTWYRRTTIGLCVASCALISACKGYQVTLNDAVLRSPEPLYTNFQMPDRNLQNCLDQSIKDIHATAPGQLTQLNCSHAGIKTLEGLHVFHNLAQINLSHNQLSDIKPLGKMGRIKLLLLNNNNLQAIPEILTLPRLEQLDLSGNANLHCEEIQQLNENYKGELTVPDHCH